jgi:hypothetical protein
MISGWFDALWTPDHMSLGGCSSLVSGASGLVLVAFVATLALVAAQIYFDI